MRMVNSLEGKPYEELLRSLGLFSLEETEGRPPYGTPYPYEGKRRGRYRSLHSRDQQQDSRKQHEVESGKIDEIEALSSIYGEDWCVVDEDEKIYCIKISDCLDQPKWTLCLQVILPPGYPTEEPPIYQLNAPWLRGQDYTELANSLEEIYLQNLGESILYLWVEKIREVLIEKAQSSEPEPDIKKTTEEVDEDDGEDFVLDYEPIQEDPIKMLNYMTSESQEDEELPPIHHGNPITDRRSTFQAHLAPVVTTRQVSKNQFFSFCLYFELDKILREYFQFARIYCEDKQTFLQDCEDDGETAAGGRLLHLMQVLEINL
ncbi:Protein IMPACT [Pitangus sulphuratus]|nr:Protein IMPACT [Pitangus sulphuratus]